jgi:hypothetical protein
MCFTSDWNEVPSKEDISKENIMSTLILQYETRPDGEYVSVLQKKPS